MIRKIICLCVFQLVFSENLKNYNEVLMGQSVLYGISYLSKDRQNSSLCYQHLTKLFQDIEDQKVWAIKTMDVSGRPGPGFFYGNNFWLGSHAECTDLSNRKRFEVSYDRVKHPKATLYDYPPYPLGFFAAHLQHNSTLQQHMQLPLEFLVQLGICAPKSCSTEDLRPILEEYFNNTYLMTQQMFNLDLKLIRVRDLNEDPVLMFKKPNVLLLIIITSLVAALAIIGTGYDVRKHNREKNLITGHRGIITVEGKSSLGNVSEVELVSNSSKEQDEEDRKNILGEIIKCFSIYSNTKKLVDCKLPADSIPIIHGLKFFGMLWVILVHSVFYQADYMDNVPIALRLSEDFPSQIFSNSTYCVDTFLFLSGFLVGYLFFKSKRSSDKPNYLGKISEFCMMIVNRFLRLTPPYLFVILSTNVMYSYYRKHSVLYSSEANEIVCTKYWWRNVLYINNLYPRSEMCMSWSWYLSVDMQFFAIAAFLLLLSTIAFKASATITSLLILANMVATGYTSYIIGYIPSLDEQLNKLDAIYDLPWNRIGPHLIGVISAYILVVKLDHKLALTKVTKIVLWTLFPLLNLWILFTIYTRNLTVEFSAVYMGISRTLWGIGLGWLMIACCTRNARALEKFLAFRGWIPLSRMTYCAYLVNPLFTNMIYMGAENAQNASLASLGLSTLGMCMTTFFIAFCMSILIESPSILLTKMLFKKFVGKNKRTTPQNTTA